MPNFASKSSMETEKKPRSLDVAQIASTDLVKLNNTVVNLRATVKSVKVQVINKLTKCIRKLKTKRGTETEKQKNLRKAERMLEEIFAIKSLKADRVSKYALANTATFQDVIKHSAASAEMRSLARLAEHKNMAAKVVAFRMQHPDWQSLTAYLLIKQTGRRFRSKKQKVTTQLKAGANITAAKSMTHSYLVNKLGPSEAIDRLITSACSKKEQPGLMQRKPDLPVEVAAVDDNNDSSCITATSTILTSHTQTRNVTDMVKDNENDKDHSKLDKKQAVIEIISSETKKGGNSPKQRERTFVPEAIADSDESQNNDDNANSSGEDEWEDEENEEEANKESEVMNLDEANKMLNIDPEDSEVMNLDEANKMLNIDPEDSEYQERESSKDAPLIAKSKNKIISKTDWKKKFSNKVQMGMGSLSSNITDQDSESNKEIDINAKNKFISKTDSNKRIRNKLQAETDSLFGSSESIKEVDINSESKFISKTDNKKKFNKHLQPETDSLSSERQEGAKTNHKEMVVKPLNLSSLELDEIFVEDKGNPAEVPDILLQEVPTVLKVASDPFFQNDSENSESSDQEFSAKGKKFQNDRIGSQNKFIFVPKEFDWRSIASSKRAMDSTFLTSLDGSERGGSLPSWHKKGLGKQFGNSRDNSFSRQDTGSQRSYSKSKGTKFKGFQISGKDSWRDKSDRIQRNSWDPQKNFSKDKFKSNKRSHLRHSENLGMRKEKIADSKGEQRVPQFKTDGRVAEYNSDRSRKNLRGGDKIVTPAQVRSGDKKADGKRSASLKSEQVHPSWEASRKRKEQEQITSFQGKRIKFDD